VQPPTVAVTGSFIRNGRPVIGSVYFLPERMWVYYHGTCWATLAPAITLNNGAFMAELTPTNTDYVPWQYKVFTPAGVFKLDIPWVDIGHSLVELVGHPSRYRR